MMTNKLNEKILLKDQEINQRQKEIESLKNELEKFEKNTINNNNNIGNPKDNKSIDPDKSCENENYSSDKYEENCYHTFSINDECFKSADVKLFICNNENKAKLDEPITIKNNNLNHNSELIANQDMNLEGVSHLPQSKSKIKQENFSVANSKKYNTHINYSHNQINNIYNNNYTQYNFNNKSNFQNFISNVNDQTNTSDIIDNPDPDLAPQKIKKSGFNYKDILPRYNRMYLNLDKVNKTNDALNHSINYKKSEKSADRLVDQAGKTAKNVKSKEKKLKLSTKSIEKVIFISESQQKSKENIKRDTSPSDSKKHFSSSGLNAAIPKHRRVLSTQEEVNKSKEEGNSKDKMMSSEKLTHPTQKLLNKYYEILSNYNKKVKKEENNNSFHKDKFDSSFNESNSNFSCSTGRSIDKFINNGNVKNTRNNSKNTKNLSSRQMG